MFGDILCTMRLVRNLIYLYRTILLHYGLIIKLFYTIVH